MTKHKKEQNKSRLCKIVYFDEESVTDYIQIVEGGKLEKTTELLNETKDKGQASIDTKASVGIGGVLKALVGFEIKGSVDAGLETSFNTNQMVKNIVKNTILTDFIDLIDELSSEEKDGVQNCGAINKFTGYKIYAPKDSLSYVALISPYLSMLKGGTNIPAGDFNIAIDKLDNTIKNAKGYYEFVGNRGEEQVIFRFNIKSFKNNYKTTDLQKMKISIYAIKVGQSTIEKLNFNNEFEIEENFSKKDNPEYEKKKKKVEDTSVEKLLEINNIIVFNGSKRDFEKLIKERISENEDTIPFMDLIQHYNARLRPNESGVGESALSMKIDVDNCIVRAEDYGSVLEHVLSNFVGIITLNHDVGTLYVHNPPKRVIRSLEAYSDNIQYLSSKYMEIRREDLKMIYGDLQSNILGQEKCKKQIMSGLYRMSTKGNDKPIVLMLYGPSGVGKTETAKSISKSLGGELLRIQFSMMQSNEAYNYIFGAEHSKGSFARDMMGRESNVILIDEFDKVNPIFYNAFYELFDEGKYVDSNYEVNLNNAIFLCTCNFMSQNEIKKVLGPAMFSRIGCCIEYMDLTKEQKETIIEKWYEEIMERLNQEEKRYINSTDILEWFKVNANRYDNIRLLKIRLENAIFDELTEKYVF